MAILTRQNILDAADRKQEKVHVPDWGGDVLVTTMTGTDKDAFEVDRFQKKGPDADVNMRNFRAALVVRCVVDEQGKRLFTDQDAEALGQKSGLMLDIVYDAAARLNGLRKSDIDRLVKNSESGQDASSTSTSQSVSAAPSASSSQPSTPMN